MKALNFALEQNDRIPSLKPIAPVALAFEISGLSADAFSGSEPDAADTFRKRDGEKGSL